MLRWTLFVYAAISICILSFILTTAGQRASTLYGALRVAPPPSVFSFSFPLPLVGAAKVALYSQLPNFCATFFSFLPAPEIRALARISLPSVPVRIPSERVQK